jgi:hypothetical protein
MEHLIHDCENYSTPLWLELGESLTQTLRTTVGGFVIVRTKIIARGTSGDDFIHLKTSYIKSKVIL